MIYASFNDRIAVLIATWLVATSAAILFLFPDAERLAVSTLNFAFCGFALWPGQSAPCDGKMRAWERVAISAWLVISPWLLGFNKVGVTSFNAIACGVFLFGASAWIVSQSKRPVLLPRRR